MNAGRIAAVIGKETREIIRDPITVWVCALLPLIMLFLFGYAINLDVDDVALGVLDQDRSPASRALTDRFVRSGYFSLQRSFASEAEAEAAMQRGEVKLFLVIPPRFYATMLRRETAPVQVLVDGTYSATALLVANYARAIVGNFHWAPVAATRPTPRLETRVWYNAPMRSVNYVVPGLYAVILMAFTPLLTALAIVREKESGSIQQIFASPLTPAEFILGKLVPYGVIAFLQMLVIVAIGNFWFAIPFRGNIGVLLATALIYVFCTVSLGLLVSTITRSQLAAMLLALIVTLMPSFLFSGMLFPILSMPYMPQLYTYAFPARYFVELSRDVVLKGAGPEAIWVNASLLALYALAVFLLAAWRLRKKVG